MPTTSTTALAAQLAQPPSGPPRNPANETDDAVAAAARLGCGGLSIFVVIIGLGMMTSNPGAGLGFTTIWGTILLVVIYFSRPSRHAKPPAPDPHALGQLQQIWEAAYYCHKDDLAFWPGGDGPRPGGQFRALMDTLAR